MRTRQLLLLVLACAAVAPAGAHAATGAEAVARLNEQRAAHGIPAGIAHNAEWSRWCGLHNEYQRINGGQLTHSEDPSKPGYTDEGNQAAGASVLSAGGNWDRANPWETAPIHLHQLLAPRLDAMGVDDTNGFTCATTLLSRNRPAPASNAVYTYPGPGTSHRASETAAEGPYTPGERVGISKGTRTGPYIYVSVDGPQLNPFSKAHMTGASLSGPDGPVEVRTVDNFTSGLEGYLPTGGQVIPVQPLKARSTYTASVNLSVTQGDATIPFERTWSFSTLGRDPNTSWSVAPGGDGPPTVSASSDSPGQLVVTATRPATGETVTQPVRAGEDTAVPLGPGTWKLCLDQESQGDYEGFHDCAADALAIGGRLKLKLGKKPTRRTSTSLVIPVTAAPALDGQAVSATITRYKLSCKSRPCKQKRTGAVKERTLTGAASFTVKVPRPAARGSVVLALSAASFYAGDVPYSVASVSRRYLP